MILRAIEVKGWRCLANSCRLGEFSEGLNIIHAPNGAGKSTLFESLQRGLFDGHKVTGEAIEQMRSWGRTLAPSVQIEFVHRGEEYRLAKRFLADRSAELFRRENGVYVLKAEGEGADREARAILGGGAPGRGAARETHWGLAQVLWAPQGRLACSELPPGLLEGIRGALDRQATDSASGALEAQIAGLYLETFSPAGRLKKGAGAPEWMRAAAKANELRAQRPDLVAQMQQWEEASSRVQSLRAARESALTNDEALSTQLAAAQHEERRYRELIGERKQLEAEAAQHESRHREQHARSQQVLGKTKELVIAQAEIQRRREQLPPLERRASEHAETENAQGRALSVAQGRRARADELRRELQQATTFIEAQAEQGKIDALLAQIARDEAELNEARRVHKAVVAPDAAALTAIREAAQSEVEVRARFEASLVTLEIIPLREIEIDSMADGVTTGARISSGERWRVRGAGEVVIHVPGFGEIRARGLAASVEQLRDALDQAVAKRTALTAVFGTPVLIELERLHDQWKLTAAALTAAQLRLDTVLGGRLHAMWQAERHRCATAIEVAFAAHPNWRARMPDLPRLQSALNEELAASADVEALHAKSRGAQTELHSALRELDRGKEGLLNASLAVERLTQEIAELRNDGLDDRERAEALSRAALQWNAAQSAVAKTVQELARFDGDPSLRLDDLLRRRETLQAGMQAQLTEEARACERLEILGAAGPFSALARLDEQIAAFEETSARGQRDAEATRLLHETVQECRTFALANVGAPVEEHALAILRQVGGDHPVTAMHLGEHFQLEHVSPSAHSGRVHIDNLSGGEKEQIHLAVRLALALVFAREERQLVVLDDVLIATDETRFARVLRLLEALSHQLQIVVLTCHPERYDRAAGAKRFDLEKIKLA